MRASVIGTSCSGKTTFAHRLADIQGILHVELDELNWGPNWTERPKEDFRQLVMQATAGEAWVIDGNYQRVRDIIFERATHIFWLNYPFPIVFWRALSRTLRRIVSKEELFSGNREEWRHFFSRDSMILWVVKTHRLRYRKYRQLFDHQAPPGVILVEITSQRQSDHVIDNFRGKSR